jgi:hypothetical protein
LSRAKTFNCSPKVGQKFLGDNFVIHTWIQTIQKTNGSTAINEMRFSKSLFVGLRAGIENLNYQPKPEGLDCLGRKV